MSILVDSIIYIVSIIGIFLIFYFFSNDDIDIINKKTIKKGEKLIEIYTYNMNDDEVKELVNFLEKSSEVESMVDIVNIYQKFDK